MSNHNAPFYELRELLGRVIERLDLLGPEYAPVRASLHTMDGALGRYADIFYPMPYKRQDDEILDLASSAIHAIDQLTEKLQ